MFLQDAIKLHLRLHKELHKKHYRDYHLLWIYSAHTLWIYSSYSIWNMFLFCSQRKNYHGQYLLNMSFFSKDMFLLFSFFFPLNLGLLVWKKQQLSFQCLWSKIISVRDENTIIMSSYNLFIALWIFQGMSQIHKNFLNTAFSNLISDVVDRFR